MIKFGILKSKIEDVLLESYKNNTFKKEIKTFKSLILDNKNVCKLFYLYDDLSSNKGLDESIVNDYINETIIIYENTINKISEKDFDKINLWVKNSKAENNYSPIDDLFTGSILEIETKIKSKKVIAENLKKNQENTNESIKLPLSMMVKIANKTISNFIDDLDESDKKEFFNLISESDDDLSKKFEILKEETLNKLSNIDLDQDEEVKNKVQETIQKIASEEYNKLSYFKLKSLNETI